METVPEKRGHEDAIYDTYFTYPRELDWHSIILDMEYPIFVKPENLWKYKKYYYISYKKSYLYTIQICNTRIQLLEEFKKNIILKQFIYKMKNKFPNLFEPKLLQQLKKFIH